MSDNGNDDAASWFAKQFGEPEPEKPDEKKSDEKKPEAESPAPVAAEPAAPPPAQGGFNWGTPEPPAAAEPPAPPAETPAVDPALWGAPAVAPEPPTVALPWESAPEPVVAEQPTELIASYSTSVPTPEPADPGNPLESLFGDTAFKEYETAGVLAGSTFDAGGGDAGPRPPRQKGDPLPRNQRILFWVAGCVVAVLVLVLLFAVGTKLPALLGPTAVKTAAPVVTPSPTATTKPVGPVAVGVHKWNDLLGGECLNPFTTVWAETFTVVDCSTAHPAQMVFRGTFPATAAAPSTATPNPTDTAQPVTPGGYPGLAALQAQINLLCTTPGVINLAAAGAYSDVQFQAAYAATAAEWNAGQHDYFCFVTRKSGDPITGSLAVAPAAG